MVDCNFLLTDLNDEEKMICTSDDNFLINACPGSGKTRAITHRLAYKATLNKDSEKFNVAITYTNRAANEISERIRGLGVDCSNIWTGTIHQFCLFFIIRPYSGYSTDLKRGFQIIDEKIKNNYLETIGKRLNLNVYQHGDITPKVKEAYRIQLKENEELDFDMILEYALELLKNHSFILENISKTLRNIHVDEYQDTNNFQYSLLAELVKCNKEINVVFVGDCNQAIYQSLGGVAMSHKDIEELFSINFTPLTLIKCYRSTQRIVKYYSHFELHQTNAQSLASYRNEAGKIKYFTGCQNSDLPELLKNGLYHLIDQGIPENEICILAPQKCLIDSLLNELEPLCHKLKFNYPDRNVIPTDLTNPLYLIAKILFAQRTVSSESRRKFSNDVLDILRSEFNLSFGEEITNLDILYEINKTTIEYDGVKTLKSCIFNVLSLMDLSEDVKIKKCVRYSILV